MAPQAFLPAGKRASTVSKSAVKSSSNQLTAPRLLPTFPFTTPSSDSLLTLAFLLPNPLLTLATFVPYPACFPGTTLLAAVAAVFASARIEARVGAGREFLSSEVGARLKTGQGLGCGRLGRATANMPSPPGGL